MPEKLITIEDAADRLAISRSGIYRLVNKGHLHICKVGAAARIAEDELDDYIKSIKHVKTIFG